MRSWFAFYIRSPNNFDGGITVIRLKAMPHKFRLIRWGRMSSSCFLFNEIPLKKIISENIFAAKKYKQLTLLLPLPWSSPVCALCILYLAQALLISLSFVWDRLCEVPFPS